MKFGVRFFGTYPQDVLAKALLAERLGYESLWRGDHLILPDTMDTKHPYKADHATEGFPVHAPLLDAFVLFGFIANATTTIRMATAVLVLPLRDPIAIARAVQSVDTLSGGRVMLGVGVGWMREEYEVAGRDFTRRGKIMDEQIDIIRALWTEQSPAYDGDLLRLPPARFEPKPIQQPHPPIIIGGASKPAYRRAARVGDGWYGHWQSPDEAKTIIDELRRLREEHGRGDDPFEVTVRAPATATVEDIEALEAVGVDRVVLELGKIDNQAGPAQLETMEEWAERLFPDD